MRWVLIVVAVVLFGGYVLGSGSMPTAGSEVDVNTVSGDAEQFDLAVEEVRPCGPSCGTGTLQLANTGAEPATNVSITTDVYAGQDVDGPQLWTDTTFLGDIAPSETVSQSKRATWDEGTVELVRSANGWVTFEMTVRTDDSTMRFSGTERLS